MLTTVLAGTFMESTATFAIHFACSCSSYQHVY